MTLAFAGPGTTQRPVTGEVVSVGQGTLGVSVGATIFRSIAVAPPLAVEDVLVGDRVALLWHGEQGYAHAVLNREASVRQGSLDYTYTTVIKNITSVDLPAHTHLLGTDLTDVEIDSPSAGQVLAYDDVTGKWVNDDSGSMVAHAITGAYHTASGLTSGNVLRATGPTTFDFGEVQHTDLGGVSANQHHDQQHALSGSDHTGDLAFVQVDSLVVSPAFTFDTAAGPGSASSLVRSDAQIALFDATNPGSVDLSACAPGSAGKAARRDHHHQLDQSISPTWTGPHVFQSTLTTRHIVPETADTYDVGSSAKWYRQQFVSQINAAVFAEEVIQLLGGWLYIPKDAGVFAVEVGSSDTQVDFGKSMSLSDFVLVKAHDKGGTIQTEYMQVVSLVTGTLYNVYRDMASAHGTDPNWAQGTPFAVLGNSGDGRIELNAYNSPKIQLMTQGSSYNAQVEVLRIGDLNGHWGYTSPDFGIAIGEYDSDKANVTIDSSAFKVNCYTTTLVKVDSLGNVQIGDITGSYVSIDENGVRIYNPTAMAASFLPDGSFWIGEGYNKSRLHYDPTNGLRLMNAADTAVLQVPPTGNAKIIGTLDVTSPGVITAGGGYAKLDSTGLHMDGVVDKYSGGTINWINSSTTYFSIGTDADLGAIVGSYIESLLDLTVSATDTGCSIKLRPDSAVYILNDSAADLRVEGGVYVGSVATDPATGEIIATSDGRFGGGLYVGSVGTNPATGTVVTTDYVAASGGVYSGANADPGTGNLIATGNLALDGGGCIGNKSETIFDNDFLIKGGLRVGPNVVNDPTAGDVDYEGNLWAFRGSTWRGPLYPAKPCNVAGWSSANDKASQTIDLQASPWSLPPDTKGVQVSLEYQPDSWEAGDYGAIRTSSGGANLVKAMGFSESFPGFASGFVPCDANGDIYFYTNDASNVVTLTITAYFI